MRYWEHYREILGVLGDILGTLVARHAASTGDAPGVLPMYVQVYWGCTGSAGTFCLITAVATIASERTSSIVFEGTSEHNSAVGSKIMRLWCTGVQNLLVSVVLDVVLGYQPWLFRSYSSLCSGTKPDCF